MILYLKASPLPPAPFLAAGFWLQDAGCWLLAGGCWFLKENHKKVAKSWFLKGCPFWLAKGRFLKENQGKVAKSCFLKGCPLRKLVLETSGRNARFCCFSRGDPLRKHHLATSIGFPLRKASG